MSVYQFEIVSPSNTNLTKRNGSSESSPTSLCTVQLTGKYLVKTLHYKHTLTLRLAHGLPSFIVTCLPIDTFLITTTIVNSALIDIGTFKSRAAHHFQSQAWCTNIVLQKQRSKHMSRSRTHVTRIVTKALTSNIKSLSMKTNLDPKAYKLCLDGYRQVQHGQTGL